MGQAQVMVEFVMKKTQLGEGDTLVVVGNIPQLGNWVPSSGLPMLLDSFPHSWSANVKLRAGLAFEYKIVHVNAERERLCWMAGSNRALLVPPFATMVSIINIWEFVAGSTPVTITFGTMKQLDMDHHLQLSGDSKEFGHWNLNRAHAVIWHVGDRWKVDVNVAAGSTINYKYVCTSNQAKEVEWVPGPNRVLQVPKGAIALTVLDQWATNPVPSLCATCLPPVRNVAVYFVLEHRCSFGHLFKLAGNIDKLGSWDIHKARRMVWHFNDIWITAIDHF